MKLSRCCETLAAAAVAAVAAAAAAAVGSWHICAPQLCSANYNFKHHPKLNYIKNQRK